MRRCRALSLLTLIWLLGACGSWQPRRTGEVRELPLRTRRTMHADLITMAENWDAMSRGRARSRREAENAYEAALGRFLTTWTRAQSPRSWSSGLTLGPEGPGGHFVIEFDAVDAKKRGASPAEYDDLMPAETTIWRGRETQALRPGLGVPLVGRVERNETSARDQPFLPPKGGHFTVTAVMEMMPPAADGMRHCRLRLHNSLNTETVPAPGGERQLAADYTAPKELSLSKKAFGNLSLIGILNPERAFKDCRLYCMDEYDPKRIPIVFVHGLMSDPHIWLNAVNAISSDSTLRRHYQPWYFLYPTAIAVPQAAAKLREALLLAREHYDPEHDDPGMQRMVLVGHSMGGLISRMQVTDSGEALWSSVFTKPLTELKISQTARDSLQQTLMVKPLPFAQRVIFIATPHRGSRIASLDIVRRLTGLIRVPFESMTMAGELLQGNSDALSPQISQWGVFSFLSLGTLSERSPLLRGLDQTRPAVRHHSIIGNSGLKWLDREKTSDGVVPYRSAHLDSASSEKMVPYLHGCSDKQEVVREITRILHEHLRQ